MGPEKNRESSYDPVACGSPQCRVNDLHTVIGEVKDDIKELIKQNTQITVLASEIANVREDMRDIRSCKMHEHDEIFNRLRGIEVSLPVKANTDSVLTKDDATRMIKVAGGVVGFISILINIVFMMIRTKL